MLTQHRRGWLPTGASCSATASTNCRASTARTTRRRTGTQRRAQPVQDPDALAGAGYAGQRRNVGQRVTRAAPSTTHPLIGMCGRRGALSVERLRPTGVARDARTRPVSSVRVLAGGRSRAPSSNGQYSAHAHWRGTRAPRQRRTVGGAPHAATEPRLLDGAERLQCSSSRRAGTPASRLGDWGSRSSGDPTDFASVVSHLVLLLEERFGWGRASTRGVSACAGRGRAEALSRCMTGRRDDQQRLA